MKLGFEVQKMPAGLQKQYRRIITCMMVLAAVFALFFLITSPGSLAVRAVLAIVALVISGQIIGTVNKLNVSYGLYLLGGKRGIAFVDSLSKNHEWFWNGLSDWGLVMSFGLLSLPIFKKRISKRMLAFGIASIFLIVYFVLPYLSLTFDFITPQLLGGTAAAAAPQTALTSLPLFYTPSLEDVGLIVLTLACGFSAITIVGLLVIAGGVLYSIIATALTLFGLHPIYTPVSQQTPGVTPIIPFVTIGNLATTQGILIGIALIISLAIILIVHEFSHGVLARISKIRIKSIGVALFGIIPMGAYVEPDEKKVAKLEAMAQDRISIAGVSANMLASLFFLALTIPALLFLLPKPTAGVLVLATVPNSPAYNVIPPASIITAWNSVPIANESDLASVESAYLPGNYVNITTSTGVYRLMPNSTGRLGISVEPAPPAATASYLFSYFIFSVVALSFLLNLFVAWINILPIPGFDGWRIYNNRIKSKRLLNAIAAFTIALIVLSALPLLKFL